MTLRDPPGDRSPEDLERPTLIGGAFCCPHSRIWPRRHRDRRPWAIPGPTVAHPGRLSSMPSHRPPPLATDPHQGKPQRAPQPNPVATQPAALLTRGLLIRAVLYEYYKPSYTS
jgi:hypothetical protein